jgi:tRNA(Ile)-lysidine synthase
MSSYAKEKYLEHQFCKNFSNHIFKFMREMNLFSPGGEYCIALSAGVDSLSLLHIFHFFKSHDYIKNLRAIHIHHNSREGQDAESNFVQETCDKLGIELIKIKLTWNQDSQESDFENKARKLRYDAFNKELKLNEALVMGHHIDDSFEWSLLQSLRSSNTTSSLGIPVKRDKIIRPMFCVSKKQIRNYAKLANIKYIEDPTNTDIKYQRNYVRKELVPPMASEHPQYLKHYVNRANELAYSLGLHISQKDSRIAKYESKKLSEQSFFIFDKSFENRMKQSGRLIKDAIHAVSFDGRGSISKQVEKIIESCENHKDGPFIISGGVKAYTTPCSIYITSTMDLDEHEARDEKVSQLTLNDSSYMDYQCEEFEHELLSYIDSHNSENSVAYDFPFWVLLQVPKHISKDLPRRKREHILWPKTVQRYQGSGYRLMAGHELLRRWKVRKNLRNRTLRIFPLWSE